MLEDFNPLHRKNWMRYCIVYCSKAGLTKRTTYVSHSFRIGAATTAAAVGILAWLIKTLGRWSSNAYMDYIQCPRTAPSAVSHILSNADATVQTGDKFNVKRV